MELKELKDKVKEIQSELKEKEIKEKMLVLLGLQ